MTAKMVKIRAMHLVVVMLWVLSRSMRPFLRVIVIIMDRMPTACLLGALYSNFVTISPTILHNACRRTTTQKSALLGIMNFRLVDTEIV